MTEELTRNGEETRGSTGLRLPRLEDKAAPPIPLPELLAERGVLSRLCTARFRLFFWLLLVAVGDRGADR